MVLGYLVGLLWKGEKGGNVQWIIVRVKMMTGHRNRIRYNLGVYLCRRLLCRGKSLFTCNKPGAASKAVMLCTITALGRKEVTLSRELILNTGDITGPYAQY